MLVVSKSTVWAMGGKAEDAGGKITEGREVRGL